NLAREVTQVPDRHLDAAVRDRGAGRERERVPGDLKRTAPQREPAELAGAEAEPGVTIGLHHQCPGIAALLAHFRDAVRPAEHEEWLADTHVKEQRDPEDGEARPQRPVPGIGPGGGPP